MMEFGLDCHARIGRCIVLDLSDADSTTAPKHSALHLYQQLRTDTSNIGLVGLLHQHDDVLYRKATELNVLVKQQFASESREDRERRGLNAQDERVSNASHQWSIDSQETCCCILVACEKAPAA
jgi:hypothetical protein